MPVTVNQLFNHFTVPVFGMVKWGTTISSKESGIYIVSLSSNPSENINLLSSINIDNSAHEFWLNNAPQINLNRRTPSLSEMQMELNKYWHKNESIIYIGKADNLFQRIRYFYNHKIGKDAPHGGGQWLKVLSNINQLFVHYGFCTSPEITEFKMLKYFAEHITKKNFNSIVEPCRYIPFANREIKSDKILCRKKHLIKKGAAR